MKAIFINPPPARGVKIVREGRCMQREGAWTSVWPPISLALSASLLEERGVQVKLHDCIVEDIDFKRLKVILDEFKPDLAVINTATPSIESDLTVAEWVKRANPGAKTAVFGIHVSALPCECFEKTPSLDFVIRGEPELTIKELALSLQDGERLDQVKGISHKRNGQVIHNEDRAFLPDLDELPFPAWHLIDLKRYVMPFSGRPFLLVATSRGCPYRCIFCANKAYYGSELRFKSPARVVDELAWARSRFGVEDFLFWAESFTMRRDFVLEVCREIVDRGLKIRWVCNSRVDNVDADMLREMKWAGCWMIGYGIECGSQRVLDSFKKGTTLDQAREAVWAAKQAGLEVTAHCVLGYPGESVQEMEGTIQFSKDLDLDYAQFYCVVPFPGSKLYEIAREKGWINTDDWRMFEQNYSVLDAESVRAEEIMSLRKRAFREFYVRPEMVFKGLKKIRSWQEFMNFVRMLKDFITWV